MGRVAQADGRLGAGIELFDHIVQAFDHRIQFGGSLDDGEIYASDVISAAGEYGLRERIVDDLSGLFYSAFQWCCQQCNHECSHSHA